MDPLKCIQCGNDCGEWSYDLLGTGPLCVSCKDRFFKSSVPPVIGCIWVDPEDLTCTNPKNHTPECHEDICPVINR